MLAWNRLNPADDDDAQRSRRARRPIVAFALLGAGYFVARHVPELPSAPMLGAGSLCLVLTLLARGAACRVLLALAVLTGGAGWFAARVNERPADSLWWRLDHGPLAEPAVVRVAGMIEDAPSLAPGPPPDSFRPEPARASVFGLTLRSADVDGEDVPVSGRVIVHIDGPPPALSAEVVRAGAFVHLTGRLRPARPPLNPGDPPRDLLASQDGRVGTLVVNSAALIQPGAPVGALDRALGTFIGIREALRARVLATLGETPTDSDTDTAAHARGHALVRAMLLGERDPALADVEPAFRRVGLLHLVAISGFNLAVLVGVTLLLIRLTGDRGWVEPVLGAAAVCLYLLVLPGEASIQRAGLTLLVFTLAESCGRRYDRLSLLACVAFVLLLIRPMDLWSLGFQLSFGVVAALLWLGRPVHERLWGVDIRGLTPTPRQRRWSNATGRWAIGIVKGHASATLLAWAVAAPLIALHSGVFSPLAPIASLVVLPATVVLLTIGYGAVLLGLVVPPAQPLAAGVLDRIGELTVRIVTRLDEWPGATVHLPRLSAAWTLLATVAVVYWLWRAWARDLRAWGLAACAGAWLALLCTLGTRTPASVPLRADVFAVGDGECDLLRSDADAMLINAGSSGSHPSAHDLARAVRALGAWHVPTVLITEPRVQSWSELPGLVEPLGVRTVLMPQSFADAANLDPTGPHAGLIAVLRARGVNIRVLDADNRFSLGRAVVTMVGVDSDAGPRPELLPRAAVQTPAGPRSILFASAVRYARLNDLPGRERHADSLVLPRTARAGERPAESIRALGSRTIVLSASPPTASDLLARLGERDAALLPTACGSVSVEVRDDGSVNASHE